MGSFGSFAHAAIHPSVRSSPATASPHCAPGDGVLTALPVLTSSLHSRRSEPCFFTSGLWPPLLLPFTPHAGSLKQLSRSAPAAFTDHDWALPCPCPLCVQVRWPLLSSSLPGAPHILSWNACLALTALACPQVPANPSFLALSLGSPQKVSDLVICGPEGTLAPLTVSIVRAEMALVGCSLIPWCSQHAAPREGRAGDARPRGPDGPALKQPRTGEE